MNVSRGARAVVASLVGLAAGFVAPAARADEPGIGVRYAAPSGCPTEREFLDNVRQRNPRVTAASALVPPQFLVTVAEGVSPRFSGKLERVTQTGAMGVREISGSDCREVTAALALITALTADLAPGNLPSQPDQTGVGAAGRTGDLAASSVASPDKEPPKEAPTEDRAPPQTPAADSPAGVASIRWQVGLEGLLASGVTPNPVGGASLFGEVGGRSSALWVPSVRLSASLGASSWSSDTTSWTAQFLWGVASLDACPLQIGDPLGVSVQPCARVTAGLLHGAGGGRSTTYRESALWTDAGGLVRVHWQVQRSLFLDGEAELFASGTRFGFTFKNPSDTAEVAGNVGFRFGLGVGLVFR
jgi:hypothetical protein